MTESLKEAAEKKYPKSKNQVVDFANDLSREGFIAGAKWQQQQQDSKKYSEEDLHNAFYNGWIYRGENYTFPKAKKEWIEIFKKENP